MLFFIFRNHEKVSVESIIEDIEYTCGTILTDEDSVAAKIEARHNLTCNDTIDTFFY